MSAREQKQQQIIQVTHQILVRDGMGKLSMRRVAGDANMSLSNLQYYYKDLDTLLIAVIIDYFAWYTNEVAENLTKTLENQSNFESFLRAILNDHLVPGGKTERCSMFREIWSLATRNPTIESTVKEHYKSYVQQTVQLISQFTPKPDATAAILLPYVEGYSIMGDSLTLNKSEVIDLLVKFVINLK
ncbi:hypothetical protein N6H18_15880 [Reichenbachiella agarivorans]|uniref:HTH tetR-type domain-containing protein n=1 Tax=Reichenbachiella agarivorans TaxID=2979464 RepID=A0ABY6CMW8_9BACT|nr:hypothetical protein [Reichenbachiella agarivorans]UXP31827.1 hypothetical protein N6H18_15880 [Reichenbachiella agarivorans]